MRRLRLEGVIFDLDGTLVNSLHDIATCINLTRGELGLLPLPEREITSLVGEGSAALVRATVPVPEEGFDAAVERYHANYTLHVLDTTRLFPGMEALLRRLAGRPLAVVTNKNERIAHLVLEGLGIRPLFSVVLCGESLPKKKPDPLPVRVTLERFGLPAHKVGLIGDGLHDVAAGKAAGVITIAVSYGVGGRAALQAEKPDYLVDSVEELDRLIG
jgi:phosphoglycolate phosphatase